MEHPQPTPDAPQGPRHGPSRRDVLAASAGAMLCSAAPAAAPAPSSRPATAPSMAPSTAAAPPAVFGSAGEPLRVGLIGCGVRGAGAARQALDADPGVTLVALGDAFNDRLRRCAELLAGQCGARGRVEDGKCFVGFDAYRKVIDAGVDVVLLATPPVFRPVHLRAAVDAGKHVFCEKPVAVDAPGVRSVLASAKLAKQKNLALAGGFCWRYHAGTRASFQQVHAGAIGEVQALYHAYHTNSMWSKPPQPGWGPMEAQLRNWLYYTHLSGDFIVEQAVHSADKMAWAMKDVMPLRASAQGGRQVRTDERFGNVFDHFSVVYEFPGAARGFLFCRQQDGCSTDTTDHVYGSKGVLDVNGYLPLHQIKGEKNWKYEGPRNYMYQAEQDELFASIRAGRPINEGARMANSTLIAILGRMAAYTGQTVTWEQAMNSKEDLTPAKWAWDQAPAPAVAVPGKTKLL